MLTDYDASVSMIRNEFQEHRNNRFLVTMETGEKKEMRLFVNGNIIGYLPKGRRRNGYILDHSGIRAIKPIQLHRKQKTPIEEKFRKNAEKLIGILKRNDLWNNIVSELENSKYDYNAYSEKEPQLAYSIARWTVKKMDFRRSKYDTNDYWFSGIRSAIEEKKEYTVPRSHGIKYDTSFNMRVCDDGIFRAWYSEEYRDCGNGHYYLAIDPEHAIFYEND